MNALPGNPRVTFLVPCFNYGNYLETCLNSIVSQSYPDLEVLILDDVSTDHTPEIAGRLCQKDARIRYVRNPENLGHLANYNQGIAQARGELLWLISADDCLASLSVLETFVKAFRDHPALGYAFCRVQAIDEDNTPQQWYVPRMGIADLPSQASVIPGRRFFRRLVQANFVPAPAVLARKACYDRYGLFHPRLTHSGDWYNWLLFCLDADVYYDPQPKVFYRKHRANMHRTYEEPRHAVENSLACYEELEQALRKLKVPPSLRWLARLAKTRFKKQHSLPLSPAETLTRLTGKLLQPL